MEGTIKRVEKGSHPGESYHQVYDFNLIGGAVIHRFTDCDGVSRSALFVLDTMIGSCRRENDESMIRRWQKGGYERFFKKFHITGRGH